VRVALVGPPGSGKGTQGPPVAAHLGVPYLSTGAELRARATAGTGLGRRVAALLARGELVPDDVVLAVVAEVLDDPRSSGYVLDGFPRSLAQAQLIERPDSPVAPPDAVVHLSIPRAVVHGRLARRAARDGRADDVGPGVVDHRLRVYEETIAPLLDHYGRRGILLTVDGDRPPAEVTRVLLATLDAVPRRN
jgi:adenylate kinase